MPCRLFCEEIDVGDNDGLRQVASGLREHYSLDEMKNSLVVVVCNLKEAKMKGFVSRGMVLAAKSADGRVELIRPPAGATEGTLIELDGVVRDGEPWPANTVYKKKVWEAMSVGLHTNSDGVACWGDSALVTPQGPCRAASITESPIG